MEAISQLLGALALVGVAAFELLQSRVNRITSEQVKDLQEQIDELKKGGDFAGGGNGLADFGETGHHTGA